MSRIELTDNMMDVVVKMAEGNPGASIAIMDIIQKHSEIDPQAAMGGLGAVMILDTWEIYGSNIYILWSDTCGKDARKMLMLMRACQLGFLPQSTLVGLSKDGPLRTELTEKEVQQYDEKVCNELEGFKRAG